MPIHKWLCKYCHKSFDSKAKAVDCEAKGPPKFKYNLGQKFTLTHGGYCEIIAKRVRNTKKEKHTPWYHIQYHNEIGVHRFIMSESTVLKNIKRGLWQTGNAIE